MSTYDKHYREQNYFGDPYPELIKYFQNFDRSNTIIDLGCGQGRDVLELGLMGFHVMGLDISEVGISQLNHVSIEEGLDVVGEVFDYKTLNSLDKYDFVLMNSMFHFYKNDIEEESNEILRIIDLMKVKARLVLVFQESSFRIKHVKKLILSSKHSLSIDYEQSIVYKEFNSRFYIISILKC